MDTITHGLTGAVIGYCGFRQRGGRAALWTCIAAAEFPDIDIILMLFGGETYLRWHRGPTHSLLLLPLWSWIVAFLAWEMSGRKNFRLLWAASAAGMASHLFLDLITSYGTMLFSPLSDARPALAWVFILDPYVWALLGVTLWAVLRLKRPGAAPWGLAIFAAYIGMCSVAQAYAAVHSVTFTKPAVFVRHYPQPMNPFRWTTVWEKWEEDGVICWNDGGHTVEFAQCRDAELLAQAEATAAVKTFRWFAEVPLIERRMEAGKLILCYRDLRFRTRMPWGAVREGKFVVAKVAFDSSGKVAGDWLTSEE